MLPQLEGFRIYRLVMGPERAMPPRLREANYDAGLHPRGTYPMICVGDEFYDRDPAPPDSERVPGKRYGVNWSFKRAYIEVTPETEDFEPEPEAGPEIFPWSNLRGLPYNAKEGSAAEMLFDFIDVHRSHFVGVEYTWGDDSYGLLDEIDKADRWVRKHKLGGWVRLRVVYEAAAKALKRDSVRED